MIHLNEPNIPFFVNFCITGGAQVIKLDTEVRDSNWPGQCNPSILWDEENRDWKLIIRNVNYVMHGSKDYTKSWTHWGPILYSIPENDGKCLKTRNFLGTSKDPFTKSFNFELIETEDYTPQWEFWGEEDARLVRWDNKLFTTGVRRDDNTDGHGRMELMNISTEATPKELSRLRIKGPDGDSTYCEKNWMPVLDLPYHYVQLANPTVVYKVDPKTGDITEIVRKEKVPIEYCEDYAPLRGSSQVVRWGDYRVAIVHTCELWMTKNNRKYARYNHAFIVWDLDWNIVHISPVFAFNDNYIEFTCGLAFRDGNFYIPFALQDNYSFLMRVPERVIEKFIFSDNIDELYKLSTTETVFESSPKYIGLFSPRTSREILFDIALEYFNKRDYAASYCIMSQSIEKFDIHEKEQFLMARCIADLGHRDSHEIAMWINSIHDNPMFIENYFAIAMYYFCRNHFIEAHYWAEMGKRLLDIHPKYNTIYYSKDNMINIYNQCRFETQYFEDIANVFNPSSLDKKLF